MVGESQTRRVLNYVLLAIALVVIVFPIYWLVNQSFKNAAEFTAMPPTLVVEHPTWANYHNLWFEQQFWK